MVYIGVITHLLTFLLTCWDIQVYPLNLGFHDWSNLCRARIGFSKNGLEEKNVTQGVAKQSYSFRLMVFQS